MKKDRRMHKEWARCERCGGLAWLTIDGQINKTHLRFRCMQIQKARAALSEVA